MILRESVHTVHFLFFLINFSMLYGGWFEVIYSHVYTSSDHISLNEKCIILQALMTLSGAVGWQWSVLFLGRTRPIPLSINQWGQVSITDQESGITLLQPQTMPQMNCT